jgi:NAD(P)-dependent dehydrogenase (short-subunit alcohol dehydrogenase family)
MGIMDFSMDFFSLHGRNAVVTGGNTGLGQAFTLALAKAGANILVPSITDDAGKTELLVKESGSNYQFMHADITRPGVPEQIIKTCADTFGSIDILINSAGICINKKQVEEFDREPWDAMVSINLTAAFDLTREAVKKMIPQRRGKIINICSLYSFLGGRWSPAYAATKHGMVGLTKAYSDELAQYNIQVNGIAPGYFATELTAMTRSDEESNARIMSKIPAERWGEREDLMGTVVYLAGSASNYVNGHILVVDGGFLVR